MLTQTGIDAIRNRLRKATLGPWQWTATEGDPQLEGSIEHAEMNPILVALGCGNTRGDIVKGCMPGKFDDPLRACPLHPNAEDRDFIAHAYDDIQELLYYVTTIKIRQCLSRLGN